VTAYLLHAVCLICRAESPVTSMRQLDSGSWLCLDAAGCYQRFGIDREHDDYGTGTDT
jgi:hypothetical protein